MLFIDNLLISYELQGLRMMKIGSSDSAIQWSVLILSADGSSVAICTSPPRYGDFTALPELKFATAATHESMLSRPPPNRKHVPR